jgi:SAM-dependent methyltransferase
MKAARIVLQIPGARSAERLFWRLWRALRAARGGGVPARAGGLRLHVGCGNERLEGYLNIDRDPSARADLILDARRLNRVFGTGFVAEILMIHALGYMSLWEARLFFREALRVLRPGGRLILEAPDLEKCAARILEAGQEQRESDFLEGVRGLFAFGPEHVREKSEYVPYAFAWAPWHLRRELESAGFTEVKILPPRTHASWRDMRVEASRPT